MRVRQGGSVGGGLLLTTQVQVAYIGVLPSVTPTGLDTDFVYLRAPGIPPSALTAPSFLTANTPDSAPEKEKEKALGKKAKKKVHPLVAIQAAPPGPRGNSLVLLNRTLYLTVDRPTFHELGIPAGKGANKRSSDPRVSLPLKLPLTEGGRAARALAPPRIAPVDILISRGSAPPVPPAGADGGDAASLHGVEVFEMRDTVPAEICEVAGAVNAENEADDEELMDAMDCAQRVLTGLAIAETTTAAETGVFRRRYVGLCNGELWDSVVRNVVASLKDGVASFAIMGALGLWSGNVNDDSEGFGGDSGVVTVVHGNGRAVTFEIRAKSDLA